MRKLMIPIACLVALGACSAATVERDVGYVNTAASAVQAGCAEALPLANAAIGIPTAGPFIATGVQAGCTAAGVAKLASDPSSAAWLGEQSQMLKDALAKARA